MKYFSLLIFILLALIILAQTDLTDFEKYKQDQERAFNNYMYQQDSLFIQYKAEIERLWQEFRESTPHEWVSYKDDFRSRGNVDFEQGKIKIEAIVDESDVEGTDKAKELIREQMKIVFQEDPETKDFMLENQVESPLVTYDLMEEEHIDIVVEEIFEPEEKEVITGTDEVRRCRYSITLDLVPDHIKIRAEKYKPDIEAICDQFKIDPAVVLAVIHTESTFNPKAYNRHGNAYGMMQIVPRYAGRTMNRILYDQDSNPEPELLFDPRRNVEIGVGYMRWLVDHTWEDVENLTNRNYCIICSYNGGSGTIYKAMTGKMNNLGELWDKMFVDLNTMPSQELYDHLIIKVPYEETRNYLKTVNGRMNKFYNVDNMR